MTTAFNAETNPKIEFWKSGITSGMVKILMCFNSITKLC